ncbi:mechanosensitive ion channel domain-containing protein [Cyclobacterium sp.]|uniref:mechanosensitive ion channel family protein n=1 Tax=Cyclobacterium sp. TaxID=1966343 RepID=UPI0019ADE8F9|nr:mechanosensitive ion channel domain-containing protein [Cyclobacterium sp.]MBD3628708.1 mechanosensitive ion channel [Cyclobacterium sp.]
MKSILFNQGKTRLSVFLSLPFPKGLFICIIFFASLSIGWAQGLNLNFDGTTQNKNDTVKMADSSAIEPLSIERKVQQTQSFLNQLQIIQSKLSRARDTLYLHEEILVMELVLNRIKDQSLIERGTVNLRFLNELENLIIGYQQQINTWQKEIDDNVNAFMESGKELSIINEASFSTGEEEDTLALQGYLNQKKVLKEKFAYVDSIYTLKRNKGLDMQSRLGGIQIQLVDLLESVRIRQRDFRRDLLKRDSPNLWETHASELEKPLVSVIKETLILNRVIVKHYLESKYGWLLFILLLFLLLFFGIRNMIQKISQTKDFSNLILDRSKYLRYSPFLSTALILFTISPFLISVPPYFLIFCCLSGSILATTFLIRIVLDRGDMFLWIVMVMAFLVFGASNLITQLAHQEKWYLLSFSLVGILVGLKVLLRIKKKPGKFPVNLPYLIYFFLVTQTVSIGFHMIGRFSLGKILGVASTLSTMQGISLYVFVLVLMEAIYLLSELSKDNQKDYANYLNYQAIYSRMKKIFSFLALLMWLYLLLVNLSLNQTIGNQVLIFLKTSRTFGNTTFTYSSILTFFSLIWVSFVLAKNIAYFASIRDSQNLGPREKRLGSSILLIRLFILTLGFFLAVTASGLPLDKLAIVLGALSVGIGFGLQTIVNNLVSGIILAFERPIQIGDAIEVGGRTGVVKEVGIRSSTLQAYDGSEVVIPNGDLLSQHLVNWTLSDKKRRVEILVGVAYGSEIEKVHDIIKKVLSQDGILSFPSPNILLHNFGDSSLEFRILFWVANFDEWIQVKDKVLREIYAAFAAQKIEIPFPQRDLHIKSGHLDPNNKPKKP